MAGCSVPLVDLGLQHQALRAELNSAFSRVLDSGRYILGDEVTALEEALSDLVGGRGVVGVSSGTDALLCALMALGVGPGDEVITTPFSFVSTATAIVRLGATPVFADIEPQHFALDASRVAEVRSCRTKAIIAVHLFGHPANMDALESAAGGVPIVEDAAQALGARWRDIPVGTFGAVGCFSFFPSKPLGAFGDAGALCCDSAERLSRCRQIRSHGATAKHEHELLGGNFRLDELQAALLRVKLACLNGWNEARRCVAASYAEALADVNELVLPVVHSDATSVFAQYTVRVVDGRRAELAAYLATCGIATAVHYPIPIYRQRCFARFAARAEAFQETELATREVLSLPMFPELSLEQRSRVVDEVRRFCRGKRPS